MRTGFKRFLSSFIVIVMIMALLPAISFAADGDTPYTSFTYTLNSSARTIQLGKYTGTATTVVVPGSYTINGTKYTTVITSDVTFTNNKSITSVTLGSGVKFKNNSMVALFDGCTKLSKVDLSAISTTNVTNMRALFRDCTALTAFNGSNFDTSKVTSFHTMFARARNLVLTGYENWNTGNVTNIGFMFSDALSNKQILDLSKWNLSKVTNSHAGFQSCYVTNLILPSSLPTIGSYCISHLIHYNKNYFVIPKATKEIGYAHVMYDFGYSSGTNAFKEFRVEEGNTYFKAVDGVLYSMDGTEFIAMPRGKTHTNNTYEMLEGVTFIPELSFSRTPYIKTLVLPNSYVIRQYVPKNDAQYYLPTQSTGLESNVNAGNSLSIAIYNQAAVANYEVKETNPRYKSDRGIIYTKDMEKLLAVPFKYSQDIIVPEGVRHWENDAMYCDAIAQTTSYTNSNITVKIPASMTYIADNQLKSLNILKNKRSWTIEVDENNPVYKVDTNGFIVQYGISDGLVSLSASSYTYNGAAKNPTVTVKAASGTTSVSLKTLTNGTHYSVEYIDNVNTGTAKVKVTGKGSYSGVIYKTFTISATGKETFESYDRNAATASSSLPTPAGTNFLKVSGVADATWKAASVGFGSNNTAHAGIIQKANGETDATDNVLAIESIGGATNWNNKARVIYKDITFSSKDRYTVKVDFYRGANVAGGGLIFNFTGADNANLSNSNYYAIDFVGKANSYGASGSGDVYATALIKNGSRVADAKIATDYSGSDYTTTINNVSRNGHDYVASTTWHTLTLTYDNGKIDWTVYRINADKVIQTGSWTDPNPMTSDTVRIALYSGGNDNTYMHFDNFSASSSKLQAPKYTSSASDVRIEFQPAIIKGINDIEKLKVIVAYYDKETNAFLRMQTKTVRGFSGYLAESFKPVNENEYAKVFIWNGDIPGVKPAYTYLTVQ